MKSKLRFANESLRRILALAMVLMMVVTSMPAGVFRVFAEDVELTVAEENSSASWDNLEIWGGGCRFRQ